MVAAIIDSGYGDDLDSFIYLDPSDIADFEYDLAPDDSQGEEASVVMRGQLTPGKRNKLRLLLAFCDRCFVDNNGIALELEDWKKIEKEEFRTFCLGN